MTGARPGFARLTASLRDNRGRWLLLAAALALAASLMPWSLPATRRQHDLVVVIDITQSMNVTDYRRDGQPVSRLDFARQALREAIPRLPCGTRLGWAIFTEFRSFLLFAPVEVCANEHELLATLARIGGGMAWSGNSEIAKGLHGALQFARTLPGPPAVVFISDGQEAPPLSPLHRPDFDGKPGEVRGLIVGAGNLVSSPIPKLDPDGRPLGFWQANEVMQTNIYAQGRGGSIGDETMTELDTADPELERLVGPSGAEHLSALREGYLKLLAAETGIGYLRLEENTDLARALLDHGLSHPVPGRLDLAPLFAGAALSAILLALLWPGSASGRRSSATGSS